MAGIIDTAGLAELISGGMDPEEADVQQALSVCGMPENTHHHFVLEGFTDVTQFRDWILKDLVDVAKTMQLCPAAQHVKVGIMVLMNLKALAFWVCNNVRCGLPSESSNFTVAELHATCDHMEVEGSDLVDKKETDITLGKMDPKKFKQWKLEFLNHLKTRNGCTGIPLAHVVLDNTIDPATAMHDDASSACRGGGVHIRYGCVKIKIFFFTIMYR
jgi:hypothetical protein